MKKIWLSMFYSLRVGEEPDSVFLILKKIEKSELSQDDTDQPLFLRSCAKDLTISEVTRVTSIFPFQFKSSMDKFLFLGTHTRFTTTKRIMVTPPLTTSI